MISQHEKRRQVWRPQTKMTCHRLSIELSLIASLPLRANEARSSYFALDCFAKNPASLVD
jgi:hypothetical protein